MKDFKLVHAYFVNKKLKELSEEDFIMPKNVFSKREDFICGKVDDLVIDIKILNITDELKEYLITKIYDIQHDAQRMENKLIFRKQEVEELKAEICRLKCNV